MGDQSVTSTDDDALQRRFMKILLEEVHALELMLERGMVETGKRRIGAEQEMFLVDSQGRPSLSATQVLAEANDGRLTTELGRFNLEANLPPHDLGTNCLSWMEGQLHDVLGVTRRAAAAHGADVLLCGILPTLRKADLTLKNMTPMPRYFALNQAMHRMRGDDFTISIRGLDDLDTTHDNVMLEACNTSFQVHFQVGPEEFAKLYNVAQAVTAPVLAAAVNSPVLFNRRLWSETRVALFEHSVDTRTRSAKARKSRTRVSFGDRWVDDSVLEIFRDDIARFRSVLAKQIDEVDSVGLVEKGVVPELAALKLHNGTVYRWNRACYGTAGGVAHLRIENRVLPSGPTVADEVANAAFFFGLMAAYAEEYEDIRKQIEFDATKANFLSAAQRGLEAQFHWFDGKEYAAGDLIEHELIPKARAGLLHVGVDLDDVDRYLGILGERVTRRRTGSRWALESLARMNPEVQPETRSRALVATMRTAQAENLPVHEWPLACVETADRVGRHYRKVGEFMTTELFTLHPEDLVDLAASVMDWEHIRHVPVEDGEGHLVGLVTHRALLRLVARRSRGDQTAIAVRDIMRTDPVTVTPDTPTLEAMETMRKQRVGCLPVLEDGQLVGIVTERDFINVSSRLLEEYLKGEG